MYLKIEYTKNNLKKVWRLHAQSSGLSVGHSKHAAVRLDEGHLGIIGLLQWENDTWTYTHLTPPNEINKIRFQSILGPTPIELEEGSLHLTPFKKEIHLLTSPTQSSPPSSSSPEFESEKPHNYVWLLWERNGKTWFSEYVPTHQKLVWPHKQVELALMPTMDWHAIQQDGITLRYKKARAPEHQTLKTGALKKLFDRSMRPYLVGALVAGLLSGLLSVFGKHQVAPVRPPLSETTLVHLTPKPLPAPQPKSAVAKALQQAQAPASSSSSPSPQQKSLRGAVGHIFSQISRRTLKNLNLNQGPKTITLTANANLASPSPSAKTFKILGAVGSGTGLGPSRMGQGGGIEKGAAFGDGPIGGAELGRMNQGSVGKGDLNLLAKESEITGGLDREVIAKYIQSQKGKILFCYERQLSANPNLFGKVSVKFQITAAGTIDLYSITESTLGNQNVESCLLQLVSQWHFPKPEGGVKVLVSYPFVFKSLN